MVLLVYTQYSTPRIDYIFSILSPAIGISEFEIINNEKLFSEYNGPRINYSSAPVTANELWIQPVNLLFEQDIRPQKIDCFYWKDLKAFFKTESEELPFDLFAAAFYLITRYEEYLPHDLDMYGRYAHENSIAFQQNFLSIPLVNLWLMELKNILHKKFPDFKINNPAFRFIPTYDIDIAFSYKEKGVVRNAGGFIKSLIKKEWKEIGDRIKTLASLATDPFDVYDWLDQLHKQFNLKPVYFYLLAATNKKYDKNILPTSSSLKFLIEKQVMINEVGIHPSWQSGDLEMLLNKEIKTLKNITGRPATKSRQHYIRMQMPATYRRLITAGILEDYSMGYGSINGFRASYCLPYKWFDLEKNETTELTIFPFCFMEANSLFEQHLSPAEVANELQGYFDVVKKVNGMFITIFHNHLITTQPPHIEWRRLYEAFLHKNCS